ncbi:hypothetical protein F5Y09DRAFT_343769 [Xylaria sp. FL1042]|nr:hypothetical protein F5Y09DRAFT_343769 [Xylaria sp. FL1042]
MPDLIRSSPNICNKTNFKTTQSQPLGPGNMTFLQCDLHNSSYHAIFDYESGRQSIAVRADLMEATPIINTKIDRDAILQDPGMEFLGLNTSLLRSLSYTAIADAFHQIVKGSVVIMLGEVNANSKIVSTRLLSTPELGFVYRISPFDSTLQEVIWNSSDPRAQSLFNPRGVKLEMSLQNALEEMFRNITISFLSSELLQPNMTSEFAPPMPNVTTTTYRSVYQYSSRQLYIAYGVAIAVSILAALLGFGAIFLNNANYSSNFSSVYRTAYNSIPSIKMQVEDMKATDPLPRYLAKATLHVMNTNSSAQPVIKDRRPINYAAMTHELCETLTERSPETEEGGNIES